MLAPELQPVLSDLDVFQRRMRMASYATAMLVTQRPAR